MTDDVLPVHMGSKGVSPKEDFPAIRQQAYVHTSFPQQLVIETTAACNQKCIFCGRTYMDRPKKTMSRAVFQKIVEEVAAENPYTEVWPTFMGEAMLLGDRLFDMIEYAREVGCKKITLNTNGTRLNEKTIPRIVSCGIDRLIVSCDALTPATHAIVRPGLKTAGGLDTIFRGVNMLLEHMERTGSDTPLLEMQYSIFDENEHEVEEFTKYWIERGTVVKTRPKLYWSGTVPGGKARVRTDNEQRVPCLWVMDTCGIHWNGNVVMCAPDCEGKYVAGNVEMQTVKEIWNGPLKWIRELHTRRRFSELPEICRNCPDWKMKRANAYFPNEHLKSKYESYVRKGRVFMEGYASLIDSGEEIQFATEKPDPSLGL